MVLQKLRRLARRAVPLSIRQIYAQVHSRYRDSASGFRFLKESGGGSWPLQKELTQVIIPGQLFENKLSNLQRGGELIEDSLIKSHSQWSFWGQIGKPSAGNGFVEGRNIVAGQLVRQVGGGLCQLSSLVHHLALLGGLEIVERHPHSLDIYRADQRFTPLGADATVVWGYKDLRLRNSHPFAISMSCFLDGRRLVGQLRSETPLASLEVMFVRTRIAPDRVSVRTVVEGDRLCTTAYEQRPGLRVE